MIELNFRATPLLKAHKQLDCTNCAQISEIQCKINYSVHSFFPKDRIVQGILISMSERNVALQLLDIRFPLRLDQNFQHTTERPVLITDQPQMTIFLQLSLRFCNELTKIGHKYITQSWSNLNEIETDLNVSCSSNLLFLRENHFQVDQVDI